MDWSTLLDDIYSYSAGLESTPTTAKNLKVIPRKQRQNDAHQLTLFDDARTPTTYPGLVLTANGEDWQVTPLALEQLCKKLGFPSLYYYVVDCPPSLAAQNLNHWLAQNSGQWILRHREAVIRGVLSPKYTPFEHSRLMASVVEGLGMTRASPKYASVDDELLFVSVTLDDYTAPVGQTRDGRPDFHTPMLYITNSEVGTRSVAVSLGVWRQICSNGMMGFVPHQKLRRRHTRIDHVELRQEIVSLIRKAIDEAPATFSDLEQAKNRSVQQPEEAIVGIAENANLSSRIRDAVLEAWQGEPSPTHFGVVQAFTSAAKRLEPATRLRLEELAGRILRNPKLLELRRNTDSPARSRRKRVPLR